MTSNKKWWSRPVWKLPLWLWIVIAVLIIGAIGSNGGSQSNTPTAAKSSESSPQENVDTTIQEVEKTTVPAKPKMTLSQENAVKEARSYLNTMAFSRKGLIEQLSSEFGSEFPLADAEFAVNYLEKNNEVDWNFQAAKSAKEYLATQSFSCNGLIEQLSSDFGGKFTQAQATYGANQAGLC